jgi:L-2-hydroxyglutarate oxidase LhgO
MTTIAIAGGGIVGLATAWRLHERFPNVKITVLEKEDGVARHQSGRNSGVIHSGIYYKPGSLKAVNCREGRLAMQRFCDEHGIPYEICGKLIVATDASQLAPLAELKRRATENGVKAEWMQYKELREVEPHATGVRALFVPETGIVDYKQVCETLRALLVQAGQEVRFMARIDAVRSRGNRNIVQTSAGDVEADLFVNCGGLHSDTIARMCGIDPQVRIVPFRGEYYKVVESRRGLCKNLIYPVPNPSFPFLGVHFTRGIDGVVECGPNAVLAFAREGYGKAQVRAGDLLGTLFWPGFHRLAARHWRMGWQEMRRSWSKALFAKSLQALVPEIRGEDLVPGHRGIRAQAVAPDGTLVDDFHIREAQSSIHVLNAPSPAATASLHIGNLIVDKIESRLLNRSSATATAS